jgi:capsular polysaccharide biosynthesis protein
MPPGAQPEEEGGAAWTSPRILYYSRLDGQAKRVLKGEKRLLEQLHARFGANSVQLFSGGAQPDPRRAARAFGRAQAVVGPHGAGLANLVYAEPGTP